MLENRFLYVNGLAGSYLNKALQILCKIYKTTFKPTKRLRERKRKKNQSFRRLAFLLRVKVGRHITKASCPK